MRMTVGEVAGLVGGRVVGDQARVLSGLAAVEEAGPEDLTFADAAPYIALLRRSAAGAALLREADAGCPCAQIVVEDPRRAFFAVAAIVARTTRTPAGVSEHAFVDPSAELGPDVSIHPLAYVGPGARVGARSILHPGVYLAGGSVVGEDCELHAGVAIGPRVRIGNRVVLHFNVSVGADGFGYLQRDGANVKVPQLGGVVIGDDVEAGAGTTIDRGTLGDTVIGEGTKIDNLVQIAHNCRIGRHVVIVAQVGLGGSTVVEDHAMIGPQAGTIDHIRVGRGARIGGKAGVLRDVPEGAQVIGIPAQDHMAWKRTLGYLARLGEALARLRRLEKEVARLRSGAREDSRSG